MSGIVEFHLMGRILVSAPGHERGLIEICKELTTIGRSNTNDVVLPDSRVSRSHASIRCSDNGPILVPAPHCTNGVFVNGELINVSGGYRA